MGLVYWPCLFRQRGADVHFFELHEGNDEVYSDVLLVHEEDMDPDEFYELVQTVRRSVQETFEEDTLIEAIANELERDYGFLYVSDQRLTAAVNVSMDEDENSLATISREDDDRDDDRDDDDDDLPDYRAVIADLQRDRNDLN